MDLPQSTQQGVTVFNYEQMDFSNISSDIPDIRMKTSDNDNSDLVDISKHPDNMQHESILHKHSLWILNFIQTRCYLDIPFILVQIIMLVIVYGVCICYTAAKDY